MAVVLLTSHVTTPVFRLLGKTRREIEALCPPPERRLVAGRAERLLWSEVARDEAGGSVFPIRVMARLYDGVVWAVGLHADDYFFVAQRADDGSEFLAAAARPPYADGRTTNWIVNGTGAPRNLGATY